MTRVSFEVTDGLLSFEAHGHAGFGVPGADIVCAGASALGYTLLQCAADAAAQGLGRVLEMEARGGHMLLRFEMAGEGFALMAGVIWTGYRMMARRYPGYVFLEGGEKSPFGMVYAGDTGGERRL